MFARPVGSFTPADGIRYLEQLSQDEGLDTVVVGWPAPADEGEGPIHEAIRRWIKRLERVVSGLDVTMVDESFSSREAEATLLAAGVKKKTRRQKGRVDQAAAAIILQRYLDGQLD